MQSPISYFSVFFKDTCVLVVVAYLLSRGRMLLLLFREKLPLRSIVLLGVCLGLVGLTVGLFPDSRVPYATHLLFVTFATLAGGFPVGLVTGAVMALSPFFPSSRSVLSIFLAVVISASIARYGRRRDTIFVRLLSGFVAGALAQTCHLVIRITFARVWHLPPLPPQAAFGIPANGFGVALLLLVVSDAQVRADSEQRRAEVERQRMKAERAQALASTAQWSALRARIHPHFLFNALNSIAELCCIAPERAEIASINLSQLMRRALEKSASATTTLREELTLVQAYLQIEQERLGARLCVVWEIAPACDSVCLAPFSIQIPVENAINHGLAPKMAPGKITITVRRCVRHILVAVQDDGNGITREACRRCLASGAPNTHGLQILDQQLRLLYGPRARLRLFSKENRGTLTVFAVPTVARQGSMGEEIR